LRGNRRQRPPDGASHARRTESCLGPEKAEAPVSGSRPGPRERRGELPCAALRCSRSSAHRMAGIDRTAQQRGDEFSPAMELVVSFHEGAHCRRETLQVKRRSSDRFGRHDSPDWRRRPARLGPHACGSCEFCAPSDMESPLR